MRTGRELILATKPFEAENVARSWYEVLATITVYCALVVIAMADTMWIGLRVTSALVAGLVHFRLFALYHDHVHGSILTKSEWAKRIMNAIGLFLLAPRPIWKATHGFHHRNNGKLGFTAIGSFRVLTAQEYAAASPRHRRRYLRERHGVYLLGGYFTVMVWGMCIEAFLSRPQIFKSGPMALAIHIGVFAGVTWGWGLTAALLGWWVPAFVGHAVASYLFYCQHNFPETRYFELAHWDYTQAALLGSSFMSMGPIMAWFTANIGYHHVHHLNPSIPFYRLPEAMNAIEELQSPKRTTWHPADVRACLSVKLWDQNRQRMDRASVEDGA